MIERAGSCWPRLRLVGNPVRERLHDLEEVLRGMGDGAVAVRRGRLAGVEDTVLLDFDHLGSLGGEGPGARALRRAVLDRIDDR